MASLLFEMWHYSEAAVKAVLKNILAKNPFVRKMFYGVSF